MARRLEGKRAKRERRLDIFRTLMRTRRTPMWPDHVGALNLVEIEFHDHPRVIEKWRKLFEHLGTPHQKRRDEEISETMPEHEKRERSNRYWLRLDQERHEILAELLHAIGKVSGFSKMEQLEIFKGGYTPQGWTDVDFEQTAVRRLFAEIYLGHRMFPIGVFHFPGQQEQEQPKSEIPHPDAPLQ
jgi:uncharacterized protein DUF6680